MNILLTKAAFLCFQLLQGTIYSVSSFSDTKSCGCNSRPSRGRKLRYLFCIFLIFHRCNSRPSRGRKQTRSSMLLYILSGCNSRPSRGRNKQKRLSFGLVFFLYPEIFFGFFLFYLLILLRAALLCSESTNNTPGFMEVIL